MPDAPVGAPPQESRSPALLPAGWSVEVGDRQSRLQIDSRRLALAVVSVLVGEGVAAAQVRVSVVVANDDEIRALNRRHLGHDYATDVLSFLLEDSPAEFEGEIIVSADTAIAAAARLGANPAEELLLYVVHGALHLAGYDDREPHDWQAMRAAEQAYLAQLGAAPAPWGDAAEEAGEPGAAEEAGP